MPKEKHENKNEVSIYLDTCVLRGAMSRRNDDDIVFLKNLKTRGWKVYTSTHTLMELYEIAKDRQFLFNLVYHQWVDVNTFLRERTRKDLDTSNLKGIVKEFNNFFRDYDFIEFMDITSDVWDDVKDIVEKSNLYSGDAMHLALAIALGCHILVTHDDFFIREGNKILEEAGETSLEICSIDKVEKTVADLSVSKS